MRALVPYQMRGTRVLDLGYEDIRSGVRGYGERVLETVYDKLLVPR